MLIATNGNEIIYEKKTITVETIIRKAEKGFIWFDHPAKKESKEWSSKMKGTLISDILQTNPIADLVFVKGKTGGTTCVDGKQRFINTRDFINNKYCIDYNIERYIIDYYVPVLDSDGFPVRDDRGIVTHKKHEFDIRMKKFEDLPKELQERIFDYSFDAIFIDYCDNESVIYHIKRFNMEKCVNKIETKRNIEEDLERFKKENEQLRKKLKTLENKYSRLGRKEKFSDDDKKKIMDLRNKGYSFDKIKDEMQCSKGLVHKIIKEYSSN